MGSLTGYLQEQFRRRCPPGWSCRPEARLLPPDLAALLGYTPRADVTLTHEAEGRRLWVEFEVSRADPVANHAKFATAHLFQPQPPTDVFVSMVSRHVDRGRRNLAASTILLMRQIGMSAVQTVLLPGLGGAEVQRLNQLSADELRQTGPDAGPEIERAFAVSTPQGTADGHQIYFAGDVVDVLLNARMWDEQVATPEGRQLWGRRRIQYFVHVPYSGQFAPSKFCAFLPVGGPTGPERRWHMTLAIYAALDESETRFDGNAAHRHLTQRLGMVTHDPTSHPEIAEAFQRWLAAVGDVVSVPQQGLTFLCPSE
jgi:hypothetical protein